MTEQINKLPATEKKEFFQLTGKKKQKKHWYIFMAIDQNNNTSSKNASIGTHSHIMTLSV